MGDQKHNIPRGVIVEFDFTAFDGAQLLFDIAKEVLAKYGVTLSVKLEAIHLVGGNCHGGVRELFSALDNNGDASACASEIVDTFRTALAEKVSAAAADPNVKAFLDTLVAKQVQVVISTRANIPDIRHAFEIYDGTLVTLYGESTTVYGNCRWDAWRRACVGNDLHALLTVAVAGSGKGVKGALVAGMSAAGVIHPHTEWQDFGGADAISTQLDKAFAEHILRVLRIDD